MVERLLALLGAFASAFIARFFLTSGSHRRRGEITAYIELAKTLDGRNPTAARSIDELVNDLTGQLVAAERASLGRRFDPTALAIGPVFLIPVLLPLLLIWPVDARWEWFVVGLAVLWVPIVAVAVWQTSWKPRDEAGK